MQTGSTMLLAVGALLLSLVGYLEATKDQCNKEWFEYMVMDSCYMDKRHIDKGGRLPVGRPRLQDFVRQRQVEAIMATVLEEMDRMHLGDNVPMATTQAPTPARTSHHSGDKHGDGGAVKAFWSKLQDHPAEILRLADHWLGLGGHEEHPTSSHQRRAIQNMLSHCCSARCSADDFDGVC